MQVCVFCSGLYPPCLIILTNVLVERPGPKVYPPFYVAPLIALINSNILLKSPGFQNLGWLIFLFYFALLCFAFWQNMSEAIIIFGFCLHLFKRTRASPGSSLVMY